MPGDWRPAGSGRYWCWYRNTAAGLADSECSESVVAGDRVSEMDQGNVMSLNCLSEKRKLSIYGSASCNMHHG